MLAHREARAIAFGTAGKLRVLADLLGPAPSLIPLKALLRVRTGGNPFFVEESVRTLVETGALHGTRGAYNLAHHPDTLQIPATVQALLAARIDRLPAEEKQLLQSAAVIGTEVLLPLLQEVAEVPEDALRRALAHLQGAEFLYETRLFPEPEYTFKHALTHDVAYGSLLQERRRVLHRRVGEAIEARYADGLAEVTETLASHFERGEVWTKAVQYLLLTAEKVKEQYAYQQAADLCNRTLALTAKAEGLGQKQERGLVLLGDLWSLMDDMAQANQYYERALALATDPTARQHIAHKRHQPHTVLRHGAKIAFYEHGGGDHTLVFVHPARVYNLTSFQPVLEKLCQEFRIITIDPRGRGASDLLPGPYRFTDHAEDVRAVIEASWAGPVVGVGASRGGTLMLTLAAAYPALLHTLVLVSSHAAPSVTYAQHQEESWFTEFTELLRQGQTEPALRIWASLIHSEPSTSHLAEQFVRATLSTISPEMLLSYVTPDPEDDVVQLLPHIRVPTLVMHGTGDRLVPFAMGRYLAEHISGAQFYAFQNRGHGLTLVHTATREFCSVLRHFIRTGSLPLSASPTA